MKQLYQRIVPMVLAVAAIGCATDQPRNESYDIPSIQLGTVDGDIERQVHTNEAARAMLHLINKYADDPQERVKADIAHDDVTNINLPIEARLKAFGVMVDMGAGYDMDSSQRVAFKIATGDITQLLNK
jgi:hypothetical protein